MLASCRPDSTTPPKKVPFLLKGAIIARSTFMPECECGSLKVATLPRRSASVVAEDLSLTRITLR